MKNQVIKINRKLYTPMGDECQTVFVPVLHAMKPRQTQQQQQYRHDSLQTVMYGCDFVVQVVCAKKVEDFGTRRSFTPFLDQSGNSIVREIAVVIPEGQEFSETNLMAATVAAFENVFAKGNDGKIAKGIVELVEL